MQQNLTDGQRVVLAAFREFGAATDVGIATYIHHMANEDMSSSGVRSRRAELVRKGLLEATDTRKMKSGRNAAVHELTKAGLKLAAKQAV